MARYPDFPTHGFNPRDFTSLLNSSNVTYRALHKRADLCPCFDAARGGPQYACPVCRGIGYTWTNPTVLAFTDTLVRGSQSVPERVTKALPVGGVATVTLPGTPPVVLTGVALDDDGRVVWPPDTAPPVGTRYTVAYTAPQQGRLHAQSITKQRQIADRGEITVGSMEVTVPAELEDRVTPNPAWMAAEHDRFVFPDLKHRHQARLERGKKERVTYASVVREVKHARAIVGGALVTYAHGTAFTLDADGDVAWATGAGPAIGTPYVVEYVAAPEYYVWAEIPQQRHVDGHDLPRRFGLRLFEQYPHRT